MTSTLPPWDPDEYDKQIRAERADTHRPKPKQRPTRPPANRPWPKPKQLPNGRWRVACVHNRVGHVRTFDTEAEAREFIRQIKEGN